MKDGKCVVKTIHIAGPEVSACKGNHHADKGPGVRVYVFKKGQLSHKHVSLLKLAVKGPKVPPSATYFSQAAGEPFAAGRHFLAIFERIHGLANWWKNFENRSIVLFYLFSRRISVRPIF